MQHTTKKFVKNFAFIDSQNLNLSILDQGWELDFARFRIYLKNKFLVTQAFIFIGYVKGNESLYAYLQKSGYIVIHKPTLEQKGIVKGNCDAELVLHTMIEYQNYDRAVIVSGDGDFYCLIEYLIKEDKLERVVVPNKEKYSSLLRKFAHKMTFVSKERENLEKKKRA